MKMLLLGVVLVLLLAWLLLRVAGLKKSSSPERRDRRTELPKSPYHAVSIRFPADACLAAKQTAGHRFLASEAPKLPLPACNSENCTCYFVHHKDRRSGKDRRSPFVASNILGSTGAFRYERRENDRRKSDDDSDEW